MPAASYGYELEIGDHAGHDDTPVCCNQDMAANLRTDDGVEYTCGDCGTVVDIDASGVVSGIREEAAKAPH